MLGIHFLRDVYDKRFPGYELGLTVPALVDVPSGEVVTNDYAQMTLDFFGSERTRFHREGAPDLYPEAQHAEMEELMQFIFLEVNNGVYRFGFAGSREAYDKAYERLWSGLDVLEERLLTRRYLMGSAIMEADVRLYPTLVRFDAVYYSHIQVQPPAVVHDAEPVRLRATCSPRPGLVTLTNFVIPTIILHM